MTEQVISGFPIGFNDLVGNNNFGQSPRLLGDTVLPTMDIGENYLASRMVVAFNPGTDVLANGANSAKTFSLLVPSGELWRVFNVSAFLATAVGDTIGAATPIVTVDGGTTAIGPGIGLAASQIRWTTFTAAPFWARAGSRFGIWGSEVVAAPTAALTLLVTKLRT